jgi:hypothetical protein
METSTLDNIIRIVTAFATLAGISALVAALVALGRGIRIIQTDEQAGKITAGLNLGAFVVLVALGIFRPDLSLDFLDGIAAQLATIALFVLGLIVQIIVPGPVFRAFAGARVPVLGVMGEHIERERFANYSTAQPIAAPKK